MNEPLEMSVHGTQRVEIIERVVHICRHAPGLILLSGETGKSPITFLRHMSSLLRNELHVALLGFSLQEHGCADIEHVTAALIQQWSIYCAHGDGKSDLQRIHEYLDLVAHSARMALVVIERTAVLREEASQLLLELMARHSRLTVLFAGVLDTRSLLSLAQQMEIPVQRIDVLAEDPSTNPVPPQMDAPEEAVPEEAVLCESAHRSLFEVADPSDGRAFHADPFHDTVYEDSAFNASSTVDYAPSDSAITATRGHFRHAEPKPANRYAARREPTLDASILLPTAHLPNTEARFTLASRKTPMPTWPQLLVALAVLIGLLLTGWLYYPRETHTDLSQAVQGIGNLPMSVGSSAASGARLVPEAPNSVAISQQPVKEATAPKRHKDTAGSTEHKPKPKPKPLVLTSGATEASLKIAQLPVTPHRAASQQIEKQAHRASANKLDTAKTSTSAKSKTRKELMPVTQKDWKSLPRDYYTVQLAAAYGDGGMAALAAKLPQKQPHLIYKSLHEGKLWHVLVYGAFPNQEAAMAAKNQLTEHLKGKSSPWVRKADEALR